MQYNTTFCKQYQLTHKIHKDFLRKLLFYKVDMKYKMTHWVSEASCQLSRLPWDGIELWRRPNPLISRDWRNPFNPSFNWILNRYIKYPAAETQFIILCIPLIIWCNFLVNYHLISLGTRFMTCLMRQMKVLYSCILHQVQDLFVAQRLQVSARCRKTWLVQKFFSWFIRFIV